MNGRLKSSCCLLNNLKRYATYTMAKDDQHLLTWLFPQHRPIKDTVTKNALVKFSTNLAKQYEEATRPMTEAEFRAFDQLHGVVDFLDEIKHENEERAEGESQAGNESVATNSTATGSTRGRRKGSAAPRVSSSSKKTP